MRRWWLDRYTLEEIRELAAALWPTSVPDGDDPSQVPGALVGAYVRTNAADWP